MLHNINDLLFTAVIRRRFIAVSFYFNVLWTNYSVFLLCDKFVIIRLLASLLSGIRLFANDRSIQKIINQEGSVRLVRLRRPNIPVTFVGRRAWYVVYVV